MIVGPVTRLTIVLAGLAVAAVVCGACSAPRDSIVVDEGMINVQNQTWRDWRNVTIRVNDHFTGGVPLLAAGGQVNAPVSQFQTAFGQKFDRGRQSVFKIEVTATDTNGKPVTLTWGQDQPQKK